RNSADLVISLFLIFCRRRRGRGQTLLGNDFHRFFDGNLGDTGIFVDPFQPLVGGRIRVQFFPQVLLRIVGVPGNTLTPRFGGHASILALCHSGGWGRGLGRSREVGGKAQNKNRSEERRVGKEGRRGWAACG